MCAFVIAFKWLTLRLHSVPEGLKKCQIQPRNADLDEKLRKTYKGLPKLPQYSPFYVYVYNLIHFSRMADYAPSWGVCAETGGYHFSDVVDMYKLPNIE